MKSVFDLQVTMFLGRYTSGPLEGSKYIQDQSTSHVFIQKDSLDFFWTQLTCVFWVNLAEIASCYWIKSEDDQIIHPKW